MGESGQFVHRDVEETLDLTGMKVDGQQPVGSRRSQQIGDQAGGDGHPRLVLLVRPAVAVIGDNRRDPAGRRPLAGVDHDQQLHEAVVDRQTRRLDDEDVPLTDVFLDPHEGVVVGKLENIRTA